MTRGRYRLYGRDATGSAAIEAAFAEAGVDYDLTEVSPDPGEAAAAGYLAVNPRGQVPALVLPDGSAIAEGTVILLHIADAFPQARLAPPPGSFARAHHDRWLLFLQANVYEGELRRYYSDRYTAEPGCAEAVRAAAEDYVKRHYALCEAGLAPGPFALGPDRTLVDLYLWMLVQWMDRDWLESHCPKITAIADAVAARPRVAAIHRRHFG